MSLLLFVILCLTSLLSSLGGASATNNLNDVVVEATLELGLWDEVEPLEPSKENIDSFLTRASEWYFLSLSPQFSSLTSFTLNYISHSFCPESDTPIAIHFDAIASYSIVGDEPSALSETAEVQQPTTTQKEELLNAMGGPPLDYYDFIQNVVWTKDKSGGIFDEVNLVYFKEPKPNSVPACPNSGGEEESSLGVDNEKGECAEAVKAFHDNNNKSDGSSESNDPPALITPACFDKQGSCDSGFVGFLHDDTILCNFTLTASGSTYNNDYPNCTESIYEDYQDHGGETILVNDTNSGKVLSPSSMITMSLRDPLNNFETVNKSLSWGIGSTCDGLVALFVQSESPNSNDGESEIIAVGTHEELANGAVISGPGMTWWMGFAMHRRRRTHEGCAIGGFDTYTVKGTCRMGGAGDDDAGNDPFLSDLFQEGSSAASTFSASVLSAGAAALALLLVVF